MSADSVLTEEEKSDVEYTRDLVLRSDEGVGPARAARLVAIVDRLSAQLTQHPQRGACHAVHYWREKTFAAEAQLAEAKAEIARLKGGG